MTSGLRPYPEMKDSGVEWLGEVPGHWRIERGKHLFRKMDRSVCPDDEVVTCFRDGAVTLRKNRRLRGFTESLKEIGYQGIRKGDLVIHAMDAFAGAVGVADSDGKGSPVYSVCTPVGTTSPQYYAHTIREMARSQWIQALAKGIRERSTDFRFEDFGSQRVPLPPPDEQAAIVRYLDYMDRRIRRYIRAKQKLVKLLEEQKQAIIHRAVTRGLDPTVRLKPSGVEWLGDVPKHWDVWRVGHFAKVGNGSTPSRGNAGYWDGGTFPWLNSSSVSRGLITGADQFVTTTALRECHLPRVAPRSILVAITGQGKTRGTAAILNIEATINQHLAYITLREGGAAVDPHFLLKAIGAAYPELRRLSDDSGSTKGALTCEDLRHFRITVPPIHEQAQIVQWSRQVVSGIDESSSHVSGQIELLREYRTRLIADVVTGKLDVREVAAHVPDEREEPEPRDETEEDSVAEEVIDELDSIPEEQG